MTATAARPGLRRPLFYLWWLLMGAGVSARDAAAATFVVNSTVDAGDAVPGNGVCATAAGACTLRAAVQEANALGGSNEVQLPAETYLLTAGSLGVADSTFLVVGGAGATSTTIDGLGAGPVFSALNGSLTLADVTVQSGSPCVTFNGGHVILTRVVMQHCVNGGVVIPIHPGLSSALTVNESVLRWNTSTGSGGALNIGVSSTVTINRSVISENSAALGGGLSVIGSDGGMGTSSVVMMVDSTVSGNTASTAGGGISLGESHSVAGPAGIVLTRSTVSGNTAPAGGGFRLFGNVFEPIAIITDSVVTGNTATGAAGGGAFYADNGTAGFTGPSRLRLTNVTVSGNVSAGAGAAMRALATTRATLTNVTLAQNSSTTGAAVDGPVELRLTNSMLADNSGLNCAGVILSDGGHNLEYPDASCGLMLASDRHADPLLMPLANNGGPTLTHALPARSPAAGAGDSAVCRAAPVSGHDQRGFIRPDDACDIGAYEQGSGPAFVDTPIVPGTTTVRAVHVTELRERVDALRTQVGLPPFAWMDANPSGVLIQAVHIQQMRDALVAAYTAAAAGGQDIPPPVFTDDPLAAGLAIKAVHIEELRTAVMALESR
jgi:CSLREA domain-containing protein